MIVVWRSMTRGDRVRIVVGIAIVFLVFVFVARSAPVTPARWIAAQAPKVVATQSATTGSPANTGNAQLVPFDDVNIGMCHGPNVQRYGVMNLISPEASVNVDGITTYSSVKYDFNINNVTPTNYTQDRVLLDFTGDFSRIKLMTLVVSAAYVPYGEALPQDDKLLELHPADLKKTISLPTAKYAPNGGYVDAVGACVTFSEVPH